VNNHCDLLNYLYQLNPKYKEDNTNRIRNTEFINKIKESYYLLNENDRTLKNLFFNCLDDQNLIVDIKRSQFLNVMCKNRININIDNLFCFFLFQTCQLVSMECFNELSFFCEFQRKYLNGLDKVNSTNNDYH